jgi:uncharacterized protein YfdQ (DUF2303 family)
MNTEAEKIQELTLMAALPKEPDGGGKPFMVVPSDCRIEDLEKLLPVPRRARGTVSFDEVESFCRWVAQFKTPGTALFVVDAQQHTEVRAVIDYHSAASGPGWCEMRGNLYVKASLEWVNWTAAAAQYHSQEGFAQFLEEHMAEVVDPPGAALLELVSNLKATRNVNFRSAINLSNGRTQLQYDDTEKTGGAGAVELPREFKLGIPVFKRGKLYAMTARLQYRITEDRTAEFRYRLQRPDKVNDFAIGELVAEVEHKTGITPFYGLIATGN